MIVGGGYVYNRLGLPFSTPLINIMWNRDEYVKFIDDPIFYLKSDLKVVEMGNLKKGINPVGMLGTKEKSVKLELVHNVDFNEAIEQWNRRRKRINYDNIFVKMGFSSNISKAKLDNYISTFNNVPYNKILFYYGDSYVKGVFKTDRFIWRQVSGDRVDSFNYNDYCRGEYHIDLDILKLLNGMEYSRYF